MANYGEHVPKWTCKTAVYQGEQLRARTHFVITAIITAIIDNIITAIFSSSLLLYVYFHFHHHVSKTYISEILYLYMFNFE